MPLARDFTETIRERAQWDSEYRDEMVRETARCILDGEVTVGQVLLRDFITAIYGMDRLSLMTGESSEDLTNMLNASDDPDADDLLAIIAAIAEHEGIELDPLSVTREESADLVAA